MAPTISEKGEPRKEAASCGKLLFVLPTELLGVNSNPSQSKQGNRTSCHDQEGRRVSDEVVPGTSVFSSSETGMSRSEERRVGKEGSG